MLIFIGNQSFVKYSSVTGTRSSVVIIAGSLESNHSYQFCVIMVNRRNASLQSTGYVLVTVEDTKPQLIAIG